MGKKGAGYAPAYANDTSQPVNSRWNPDHNSTARERESVHAPLSQVDAWRSYRDDTTNLVQTANYTDRWNMPHTQYTERIPRQSNPQQQVNSQSQHLAGFQNPQRPTTLPLQLAAGQQLNPFAEEFQPSLSVPYTSSAHDERKSHKSQRVSQGKKEKLAQHSSSNSSSAKTGSSRYPLRSHGLVGAPTSIKDVPFPSIEHQSRHSSSIPNVISSYPGFKAPKRPTVQPVTHSPPPVPVPIAAPAYLAQASHPPSKLTTPQHLLVVLDLNGTLLKRTNKSTSFHLRPGITKFLDYLFANHTVMIYSSARPDNVTGMVAKLFTHPQRQSLAAVWARDKLDLTAAQYCSKVQVYKKLEKIWNDPGIQQTAQDGRAWGQNNTVLIDDSHLKGAAQPHNLLLVEEFTRDEPFLHSEDNAPGQKTAVESWKSRQEKIVEDLQFKLEVLKWTDDVSRLICQWQSYGGPGATKDQIPPTDQVTEPVQLPTPMSLRSDSTDGDQSDGGVDYKDVDIDELAKNVEDQLTGLDEKGAHGRSVSPIDESVFKELLGDAESSTKSA